MERLISTNSSNVYALKINNDEEYNGRYLIFIEYINDKIKLLSRSRLFRVKISKDNKLPNSILDINKAEYIKGDYIPYDLRVFPASCFITYEEIVKRYGYKEVPDEYNYLYCYIMEFIISKKKIQEEFIYLGSYNNINLPEYEYIPHATSGSINFLKIDDYEKNIIHHYNEHNLKRAYAYSPEGIEFIKRNVEIQKMVHNSVLEEIKQAELGNRKIEFGYSFGWGVKLYECDVACDVRDIYNKVFSKIKNESEAIKEIYKQCSDFINDKTDSLIFYMVIANQQMKHNRLDKELKQKALESIETDLSYWKDDENYENRKKELYKLKSKLEKYDCEE